MENKRLCRKLFFLSIFSFILTLFCSCSTKFNFTKTEIDQLFEIDFSSLDVPEISSIKTEGESRQYPYATFGEVWDSAIIVLMQKGIIARSLKDSGIIVSIPPQQIKVEPKPFRRLRYHSFGEPPLVVFIEKGEIVTVYLKWLENLYQPLDKSEKVVVGLTMKDKEKMADILLGKLATQLYVGQKWKYLYK